MLHTTPPAGNTLPLPLPASRAADADRQLRTLRRTFVAHVAARLADAGVAVRPIRRGTRLVWRDPGERVGELHVHAYLAPSPGEADAPLIVRAVVNRDFTSIPAGTLRSLGLSAQAARNVPHIGGRLELSLLPAELLDFGPWLAAWIVARQQLHGGTAAAATYAAARRVLGRPPVGFERVLGDVRRADYLWTATAAERHDCYRVVQRVRRDSRAQLARLRAPAHVASRVLWDALRGPAEDVHAAVAELGGRWYAMLDDQPGGLGEAVREGVLVARRAMRRLEEAATAAVARN